VADRLSAVWLGRTGRWCGRNARFRACQSVRADRPWARQL